MVGLEYLKEGCTHPHSSECHASFDPDCPKLFLLEEHGRNHTGWAVECQLAPCRSSPWINHQNPDWLKEPH